MTCVFVALCAFDTGVVLILFNGLFVAFGVIISLVLAEEVFVMFGMFGELAVLVSDAVFLLSLCLVVLQKMNTDSKSAYRLWKTHLRRISYPVKVYQGLRAIFTLVSKVFCVCFAFALPHLVIGKTPANFSANQK